MDGNLITKMALKSEVPVQYSPGLPRVKSLLVWGFLGMTVGFIIALIPVSKGGFQRTTTIPGNTNTFP